MSWPAWYYGPEGGKVFQCAEDVPEGWTDHPQPKVTGDLNGDGVLEPSKAEIVKALRAKEPPVEFDARWSISKLQALL